MLVRRVMGGITPKMGVHDLNVHLIRRFKLSGYACDCYALIRRHISQAANRCYSFSFLFLLFIFCSLLLISDM